MFFFFQKNWIMRQKKLKKYNANAAAGMPVLRFPNGHCLSSFWNHSWRTNDLQIWLAVLLKNLMSRHFKTQPKNRKNFMPCKFLAAQSRWNFKNRGHKLPEALFVCKSCLQDLVFLKRWPIDIYKMLIQIILFIYIPSIKTEWIIALQGIDFSKIIVHWY